MKAEELRIGNWVKFEGQYHVVTSLHREGNISVRLHNGKYPSENTGITKVTPIPLTEEWLLKFGWAWNKETYTFEKYPDGDARMHLEYRDVNNSYTMFNYVLKAVICKRIFYVHQLQNLYYALTGTELKTKS